MRNFQNLDFLFSARISYGKQTFFTCWNDGKCARLLLGLSEGVPGHADHGPVVQHGLWGVRKQTFVSVDTKLGPGYVRGVHGRV